jgi:hypothetical protein
VPVKKTTSRPRRAASAATNAVKRPVVALARKSAGGKGGHRRTNASTRATVTTERRARGAPKKRAGKRTPASSVNDRQQRLKVADAFRDEALFDYAARASKPAMAKFWQTPDSH